MGQRELRVVPIMVHVEPTLHERLREILDDEAESASTFLRRLLIGDLQRRGKLSDQDLLKITAGRIISATT